MAKVDVSQVHNTHSKGLRFWRYLPKCVKEIEDIRYHNMINTRVLGILEASCPIYVGPPLQNE